MALPLIAGLPAAIASIGSTTFYVVKFIYNFVKARLLKFPFFMAIFAINLGFLSIFVIYFRSIIYIIKSTYDGIQKFISYLSFTGGSSELVNLTNNLLGSLRFYEALNDVITLFSPLFSSCFVAISLIVGYKALTHLRISLVSQVLALP